MRRAKRWLGVLLLLSLGCPEVASAQEGRRSRRDKDQEKEEEQEEAAGYDDWTPYAMRDEISLEAWWWSTERFGSSFAFDLAGQAMMTDNVALAFHLPWTFNVRGAGDPIGALGNPTVDVHYAARAGIVTWHAGGGFSAPLASAEDESGAYRLAATVGTSTLALYDAHLFVPAYMPIRAYGGVELRATKGISIRLGLDPMLFAPLESQDAEFLLQQHVDFIGITPSGFGGGLRFQGVHPLTDDTDMAQLSLEPYVAFDDEEYFFMKLGLLMALDTPLGFAFEEQKVLALHLTIGGYTDEEEEDAF